MICTIFPTISFRSLSPFSLLAVRGSPHTPLPVTWGKEPGVVVIVEYAILDLDSLLRFGSALSHSDQLGRNGQHKGRFDFACVIKFFLHPTPVINCIYTALSADLCV